jgi:predicted alpha/beta-hydrolase family hydrolase
MTDMMGSSTQVSDPTQSIGGTVTSSAAPGATAVGGQMSMTSAVLWTIGASGASLVALGFVFRKGAKPAPLRVDAANALNVYFSWLLIHGTVKVLAYRFHGHKVAQAYLLIG